jgi:hypothetical protein
VSSGFASPIPSLECLNLSNPLTRSPRHATNTSCWSQFLVLYPPARRWRFAESSRQAEVLGGLRTVTLTTPRGHIKVILPDNITAGDTILGTVAAEPKGKDNKNLKIDGHSLTATKLNTVLFVAVDSCMVIACVVALRFIREAGLSSKDWRRSICHLKRDTTLRQVRVS